MVRSSDRSLDVGAGAQTKTILLVLVSVIRIP